MQQLYWMLTDSVNESTALCKYYLTDKHKKSKLQQISSNLSVSLLLLRTLWSKTAMNPIFPCILLLLSLSGTFTKYVYIEEKYSWKEALDYCCQHHTDLAPVNNERDIRILQELSGGTTEKIWIGLVRRSSDKNKWLWSGGGEVSRFFWEVKQPDNKSNDNYGYTEKNRWHDSDGGGKEHVFCYWPVVATKKKLGRKH